MANSPQQIYQVIEIVKERVDGELTLGCAIGGGIDQDENLNPFSAGDCGIFVSKIRKHGSADKAGLEVGDKLIQVNGNDLTRVTHSQAIRLLTDQNTERLSIKVSRSMVVDDPRLMMKRAAVEFKQDLKNKLRPIH